MNKYCSDCGSKLVVGGIFCSICGKKQINEMNIELKNLNQSKELNYISEEKKHYSMI